MTEITLAQEIDLARRNFRLGRSVDAEAICRRILARQPDHADALCVLAIALQVMGRVNEAIDVHRRAIALRPGDAETHNNLGAALQSVGQIDEAIASYMRAIGVRPDYADAHFNLGIALKASGRLDEAVAAYRHAIGFAPDHASAHNNLGNAFNELGQWDEAIAAYRRAVMLKPDSFETHINLGVALHRMGQVDEAISSCNQAMRLKPDNAEPHYNLGTIAQSLGRLDEAIFLYQRAIQLKPDHAAALNNLGNVLKETGRMDAAIAAYRHAMTLRPEDAGTHSNLIVAIQYRPRCDGAEIGVELAQWNTLHAEPLMKFIRPHAPGRDGERRLRVGYVSPDFCQHVVGQNLLPLLRGHDHAQVEVLCYANVAKPDAMTAQFRRYAHNWRSIVGQADARVADLIREDRIDILVDLALHTSDNRLPLFAHKPAPVQATFAGYPGSTGMEAIDYRLSDPYLDPPGLFDAHCSERSIRLPHSFWCYDSLGIQLEPNDLPAKTNGYVTFGCLNNFCKVNEPVLQTWATVLKAVDHSRLILLCPEGSHRQALLEKLHREGIDAGRIELAAHRPRGQYLELYHRIDLGLDTFPYNGHTTSLDSYWMGVPVVTLVGQTIVGRAGLSQLSNLGLAELAAGDRGQYVKIAVEMAGNRRRLAELRRTLRPRMIASPLMDAHGFARNIEAAYRRMWRAWCSQ